MTKETLSILLVLLIGFGVWFYYFKWRPTKENPATPGFRYTPPGFVGPPSPIS